MSEACATAETFDLSKLPRFRVGKHTTAVDLLEHIIDLTLEEPKRMWLSRWGNVFTGSRPSAHPNAPVCGTVGCIGGWACFLVRGQKQYQSDLDGLVKIRVNRHHGDQYDAYGVGDVSAILLGISGTQRELFNAQQGDNNKNRYGNVEAVDGSVEQAVEVVRRIRRFIRLHRSQLLATKIRQTRKLARSYISKQRQLRIVALKNNTY